MIYLSFHWQTEESVRKEALLRARKIRDALIAQGMTEAQADDFTNEFWQSGYDQGRDAGEWDASYAL